MATVVDAVSGDRITDPSPLAAGFPRVIAYLIDLVIIGALAYALVSGIGWTSAFGLALVLGHVTYFTLFEGSSLRASPGKLVLGLCVASRSGDRLSVLHALARNIAKSVTASLGFLFRLLWRRPPYHDALAGTVVLRRKFQSSYEGSTSSASRPGLTVGWGIVGIFFAFGLFRALFLAAAVSLVFVGSAMAPTYVSGQHIIAMRTSYLFSSPQRGDVIVFHAISAGAPNIMMTDRIVGIPGDVVAIRDRGVMIDGLRLPTPRGWTQPRYDWGPRRVPAGHYFVLGDNRADSFDSHDWPLSPWVARDDIVGKVH